jgi:uncharacterized protein DUF5947
VGLRRFVAQRRKVVVPARCDLCAAPAGDGHGHVVDLEERRILCACRPCTLLFTAETGRFRTAPRRYRHDPGFALSDADWHELTVPVRMAFFFHDSRAERTVACYPSPGGATESEPPADAWTRVLAATPALADVRPDVEALLIDRDSGAYLVPIDACYELTGIMRTHWTGFDGGDEARRRIGVFFADLRERAGNG